MPELCELYKEEHPEKTNKDIQEQVTDDLEEIWERSSIYVYIPSWLELERNRQNSKKGWETRNAVKIESAMKKLHELSKIELPEPLLPKEQEEKYTEFHDIPELERYGEEGQTLMTYYASV